MDRETKVTFENKIKALKGLLILNQLLK